ncbi:MAG: NAD(P)H-hydrate dehydratase [Alphaproteobacteria bacterium]|nr:NAD(P)H-hydrate dehydratase [Alphaproteobacteria bacterium]
MASSGTGGHQQHLVLSVAEMYAADAATIAAGVSGEQLMEAAGTAVAGEVRLGWSRRPVVVLCGPGNNGGDGFVAARLLQEAGWPVCVALLGDRSHLGGDAALNAKRWSGDTVALEPSALAGRALVIDAIFGAGLTRPLEGAARATLERAVGEGLPLVAVDVPSGVHGDSGAVLGYAAPAARTVTFVRKKPGHLLLPGRLLCGKTRVAEIGTPSRVSENLPRHTWDNHPDLWRDRVASQTIDGHKYARGYAVVVSGGVETTGAARLAATAALQSGAGLVGVACPADALAVLAASLTAVMTKVVPDLAAFEAFARDPRRTAILLGPGNGINERTRSFVLAALSLGKACVIDADAITVFASTPNELFSAIQGPCLLTPHEGEFVRLFPDLPPGSGSKLERAREAARRSGATVLLKGPDTVVATPDGRATINANAPPALATAGTGDVLAGIALGLMARGIDPFRAGSTAAWIHGETARPWCGGMTAEDLASSLGHELNYLYSNC